MWYVIYLLCPAIFLIPIILNWGELAYQLSFVRLLEEPNYILQVIPT